eukprot:103138_1
MSFASILRSRIPSKFASTLSSPWAFSPSVIPKPLLAVGATQQTTLPQIIRSVWIEVVRQVPSEDPNKPGQMEFEDVDLADMRMVKALRAETPLRRRPNFVRHEKQWQRRKRLKMERRYMRLEEGVKELKAYIKFKQDNKPDW